MTSKQQREAFRRMAVTAKCCHCLPSLSNKRALSHNLTADTSRNIQRHSASGFKAIRRVEDTTPFLALPFDVFLVQRRRRGRGGGRAPPMRKSGLNHRRAPPSVMFLSVFVVRTRLSATSDFNSCPADRRRSDTRSRIRHIEL